MRQHPGCFDSLSNWNRRTRKLTISRKLGTVFLKHWAKRGIKMISEAEYRQIRSDFRKLMIPPTQICVSCPRPLRILGIIFLLSKRESITGPELAKKLKVSASTIHGDMKIFVNHRLCKRSGYKGYERTDRFQPVVRHLRKAKAIPSQEKTWGRLIEWRKIVGS